MMKTAWNFYDFLDIKRDQILMRYDFFSVPIGSGDPPKNLEHTNSQYCGICPYHAFKVDNVSLLFPRELWRKGGKEFIVDGKQLQICVGVRLAFEIPTRIMFFNENGNSDYIPLVVDKLSTKIDFVIPNQMYIRASLINFLGHHMYPLNMESFKMGMVISGDYIEDKI
jgi:hypothetical protein